MRWRHYLKLSLHGKDGKVDIVKRSVLSVLLPSILASAVLISLAGCGGGSSSAGSNVVSLKVIQPGDTVPWAAFQDGNGVWQPISSSGKGVFSATVTDPQGRYGFAYVVNTGGEGSYTAEVCYATTRETRNITDVYPPSDRACTVSGSVLNAQGDIPDVYCGWQGTSRGGGSGHYSTGGLAAGQYDLLALLPAATTGSCPTRMVLDRNLVITGNTTHDLDFGNRGAIRAVQYTITAPSASVYWGNKHLDAALMGSGSGSIKYAALPESAYKPGDMYWASSTSRSGNDWFTKSLYFRTASDKTIDMKGMVPFSSALITSNGANNLTASWDPYPGALGYVGYASAGAKEWYMIVTAGRAGASHVNIPFPDFRSVKGWNSSWNCPSAPPSWGVSAVQSNVSLSTLGGFDGYPGYMPDGATESAAIRLSSSDALLGKLSAASGHRRHHTLLGDFWPDRI